MNIVRTLAAALLAAALAVPSVYAEEAKQEGSGDGEWSSKYGMIFSVQNVFQNGQDGDGRAILGDFGGGVGLQYNLAPQRALRISAGLSRESNPGTESETTVLPSGTPIKTYSPPAGFSSQYDVDLGALYVMRLAPSSIAPYLGFGGGLGYFQSGLKYEDDINDPTEIENVDNMDREFSLNAAGVLGVEWRVHKSIALFAEYGLGMELVTFSSTKDERTLTSTATGLRQGIKSEGSSTKFFNFDTGLGQGGQLGLVAFF